MTLEREIIKLNFQCVVFGRGSLVACFQAVASIVPAIHDTTIDVLSDYAGDDDDLIPRLGESGTAWSAIEGTRGSAIYFTPNTADSDRLEDAIRNIMLPLERRIRKPWSYAEVKAGALVPREFAEIFGSARFARVWELPDLGHLRPAGGGTNADVVRGLAEIGWEDLGSDMMKKAFFVSGGQCITVIRGFSEGIPSVFVPVSRASDGASHRVGARIGASSLAVLDAFFVVARPIPPDCLLDPRRIDGLGGAVAEDAAGYIDHMKCEGRQSDEVPRPATIAQSTESAALSAGENCPVPETALRVVVSWDRLPPGGEIDTSALLVTATGRTRSDDDVVFFNQLRHPRSAVELEPIRSTAGGGEAALGLDLRRIEPDVQKIVVVAAIDGATAGSVGGFRMRLLEARAGTEVTSFLVDTVGPETAVIVGEVYRRPDCWKFRAVGQGYTTGLRGVIQDYGVSVDS